MWIGDDICCVKDSVEIICWGFDLVMELEWGIGVWLCGEIWGDLLCDVVVGCYNEGKLV